MVERKCLNCNHWNKAEDYCLNCGAPISPKAIDALKEQERKEREIEEGPSKMEIYLEKARSHPNFFKRWGYKFIYSAGLIATLFAAFMAWMAALANA